uniref:Uncharacterized protein n=1 Tax=Arundo donax TaxID=35708 RepID=A0A0A9AM00_ARUDO
MSSLTLTFSFCNLSVLMNSDVRSLGQSITLYRNFYMVVSTFFSFPCQSEMLGIALNIL